jgi:predicted translin family RNA/ssDNA-binding protein
MENEFKNACEPWYQDEYNQLNNVDMLDIMEISKNSPPRCSDDILITIDKNDYIELQKNMKEMKDEIKKINKKINDFIEIMYDFMKEEK